MNIDGHRHTKRVDTGHGLTRQLRQALADLTDDPGGRYELPSRTVGDLGGLCLRLDGYRLGLTAEVRLTLALDHHGAGPKLLLRPNDLDNKRPDTLITQLEGLLRRLETDRSRASADAEMNEARAAEAETRTGQPFADQHRLDQLRRRYRQILDELNAQTDGQAALGRTPRAKDTAELTDRVSMPHEAAAEPLGLD